MPQRSATGSRTCWCTAPAAPMRSSWPRRGAPSRPAMHGCCRRSPSWPPPSRPPPSAGWKRWRRAQLSSPRPRRCGRIPALEPLGREARRDGLSRRGRRLRRRARLAAAPTAQAFVQAFAANLVSAGVRLIPLGQTDGLRVHCPARAADPAHRRRAHSPPASTTSAASPSGRHRLHAARDPVHAAVPLVGAGDCAVDRLAAIAALHAAGGSARIGRAERGEPRQCRGSGSRRHENVPAVRLLIAGAMAARVSVGRCRKRRLRTRRRHAR